MTIAIVTTSSSSNSRMARLDSATLAKLTESPPTKASPRLTSVAFSGDIRPEKVDFTRVGVKFTSSEFQIL